MIFCILEEAIKYIKMYCIYIKEENLLNIVQVPTTTILFCYQIIMDNYAQNNFMCSSEDKYSFTTKLFIIL